jgi:hypothetical protein
LALTPIPNHIDQALSRLIDRYKTKPRFAAWCASHVRQVQKVEDAIQGLLALLDVDNADAARLALLGKIVGQPLRGTLDQFRLYIKARIAANRSLGRAPDVIRVALLLLGPVTYTEGACNIVVECDEAIGIRDPNASFEILDEVRAGGVGLRLVYFESDPAATFELAAGSAYVTDPGRGLAPTDTSYGGALSEVRGPGDLS